MSRATARGSQLRLGVAELSRSGSPPSPNGTTPEQSLTARNKPLEQMYMHGEIELELTPQGTLAERMRAAGAGIPAFYTPTGNNTPVQQGTIPTKHDKDGKPLEYPKPREQRVFNGREYCLEESIYGDVALIRAWKVDEAGNAIFRYTANNFATAMAKSAKITIVEVSGESEEDWRSQSDEPLQPGGGKLMATGRLALRARRPLTCRPRRLSRSAPSTRWRSTSPASTSTAS